jgi:hypothetical protein
VLRGAWGVSYIVDKRWCTADAFIVVGEVGWYPNDDEPCIVVLLWCGMGVRPGVSREE